MLSEHQLGGDWEKVAMTHFKTLLQHSLSAWRKAMKTSHRMRTELRNMGVLTTCDSSYLESTLFSLTVITERKHAKHMYHIIVSSVACPALQYLSTSSQKCYNFCEKVIEHKMWVLTFSTTFVRNTSHSKMNLVRYYHRRRQIFMQSTH
jgi:hypothetical protein